MAMIRVATLTKRAKDLRDAPASQLLAIPNYRRLVAGVALGLAAFNINIMREAGLSST